MMNKLQKFLTENYPSLLSVAVLLSVWETSVRLGLVKRIFVSMPSEIISQTAALLGRGEFWDSFGYSLVVFYSGLLAAVAAGFAIGLWVGYYRTVGKIFKPYVFALSALPMAALVPLVIIWLGIGMASKITIVFLMVLVPVAINTIEGVKNADNELKKMARSFGASDSEILRSVVLFEVLPYLFSGAKIGVGRGIVGLVIAEIFGYGVGLGYLVAYYGNTFQTANLLVVIAVLVLLNFATVFAIDTLRKKIIKWR